MQKRIAILGCFIVTALTIFSLTGCVNLGMRVTEGLGRVLDGSAFKEKITARYYGAVGGITGVELREIKNRAGEYSIIIVIQQFTAVKLRGSLPDAQGNFRLNSLEFLGGTFSGWNEFTLAISAEGSFARGPDGAGILRLTSPLDAVEISAGKIRRGGNRLIGDEALTSLRNRRERITALTEWMHGRDNVPFFATQDVFTSYWRPILLPEILPKKERPPEWHTEDTAWAYSEDIRWNTAYTKQLFPETLWILRDSGALLRDWEEAAAWIYMEYQWDTLLHLLQDGLRLTKGKVRVGASKLNN